MRSWRHFGVPQDVASDAGSAVSRGPSPRPESEPELKVGDNHPPAPMQSVLDKLKQQLEDMTNDQYRQVSLKRNGRVRAGGVNVGEDARWVLRGT